MVKWVLYVRSVIVSTNMKLRIIHFWCYLLAQTVIMILLRSLKILKAIIYAKCIVCGNLPENIFIDADGNQVSYESKILNDIKDMVYRVEQRISDLEREAESLGSGQVLIEQSIAYINQFLSENK